MRLNTVPENLFERIALRAGVVPTPLGDTIVAMTLARTIMVATKLGIFEALAKEENTAYEIAACCSFSALEVARRIPVPRGARHMLDIGGSHGYYSVMLCRLHPGLCSVVLDLPQAIPHAAKLLAQEGMGERIVHRAGNALTDELGDEEYDLIFVGNLLHHFDEHSNRDLVKRSARALRPGGYLVIEEFQRFQCITRRRFA